MAWHPSVDMYEDDENMYVKLDLPGISKDDINISFDGHILSISGRREEEESDESESIKHHRSEMKESAITRDKFCRVLTFHPHTETSLLCFVRNCLSLSSPNSLRGEEILSIVDKFCLFRHWMMHIGPSKKDAVVSALDEALRLSFEEDVFVAVELGTYCGYSAILLGMHLQSVAASRTFHLYTFEICQEYHNVAREMIRLAGLESVISAVLIQQHEIPAQWISRHHSKVHFLFLDHDKDRYLTDFISFQQQSLLRKDTVVVADNVLFSNIHDYLSFVRHLQKQGQVQSKTVHALLEYAQHKEEYMDALEITIFISCPPQNAT